LQFFIKIDWGQIEKFGDQNEKFEKNITMKNFKCHLKFSKFNLNKILHKFPSF